MKKTNHHWEMCICSKKHVTSSTKSYPSLAPKLTPSPLGNKLHSDTGWSVCRGDIAATCWSCSAPFSSSSPTDTGVIENTCTRCSATCKIKYQRQRASAVLESCKAVKWNHQGHPGTWVGAKVSGIRWECCHKRARYSGCSHSCQQQLKTASGNLTGQEAAKMDQNVQTGQDREARRS